VPAGSTLRRTVALAGLGTGSDPVEVDWEARLNGALAAGGREVAESRGGASRIAAVGPPARAGQPRRSGPQGGARTAGAFAGEASFPFLVYPGETGGTLADLFGKARVALYDPEGGAARFSPRWGCASRNSPCSKVLALYRET